MQCVCCSGSSQTLSFAGVDGRIGAGRNPAGFSDDEISLSPPRHSYVLELDHRHHGPAAAGPVYHAVCSDDDLAFTSSDDAIGKRRWLFLDLLWKNFCNIILWVLSTFTFKKMLTSQQGPNLRVGLFQFLIFVANFIHHS